VYCGRLRGTLEPLPQRAGVMPVTRLNVRIAQAVSDETRPAAHCNACATAAHHDAATSTIEVVSSWKRAASFAQN
jgi:hypothetical protein